MTPLMRAITDAARRLLWLETKKDRRLARDIVIAAAVIAAAVTLAAL